MDLSGDVGGISHPDPREPLPAFLGQTSISDAGNGQFHVDSFFDVFTEISIAGGPFEPQTQRPSRMELERSGSEAAPSCRRPTSRRSPSRRTATASSASTPEATLHALLPERDRLQQSDPQAASRTCRNTTDPATGDETETFDSTVEGTFDDGSGPQPSS